MQGVLDFQLWSPIVRGVLLRMEDRMEGLVRFSVLVLAGDTCSPQGEPIADKHLPIRAVPCSGGHSKRAEANNERFGEGYGKVQ